MNDFEQNLRRQLKSEADDILFGNLHFDSRMRDQVLGSVMPEERGRMIFRKWFRGARKIWVYGGTAAVAAVLGLLLVYSPAFRDGNAESTDSPAPMNTTDVTLEGPRTWTVQTVEEAKSAFGSELRIPSYSPDDIPLSGMHVTGEGKGKATKLVLNYMYGETSYAVIAEKGESVMLFEGFEKVGINGSAGYLKSGAPDTELRWSADGVHYTVIGMIDGAEAVKVAQSMK